MDTHVRFAQRQSLRKIARELGISRNTVKHHLQQQTMSTYAKRSQQPTILNKLQDAQQDRERGLLFVSSAG